jgi:hypothetical protein
LPQLTGYKLKYIRGSGTREMEANSTAAFIPKEKKVATVAEPQHTVIIHLLDSPTFKHHPASRFYVQSPKLKIPKECADK